MCLVIKLQHILFLVIKITILVVILIQCTKRTLILNEMLHSFQILLKFPFFQMGSFGKF